MKFRRVNVLLVELIAEAVRQRPKLFDVKLGNQCTGSILYFPYFSISFLISPRSLNFYKKFRKFESKPRAEVFLAKLHPNSHNLCNSSRSIWILKLQDKRSPIHSTKHSKDSERHENRLESCKNKDISRVQILPFACTYSVQQNANTSPTEHGCFLQ